MKNAFYTLKNSVLLVVMAVIAFSCSNDSDSDATPSDFQLSETELQTILETDDISGVADTVLAEVFVGNNTTSKGNDCYEAAYSDTGFTVVFNNCVLNGTDNVNGTLTVVYEVDNESAAFTATYSGFFVGDIEINGTRSFGFDANMDQSSYSFVVNSNMEITLADESKITENGTKVFGFSFGQSLEDTSFTLSGNWSITVGDNSYSVEVNETLEGNLSCEYLTSGSMDINKNGLEVTVDFGDGTCDDIATIIYPNGATEDVSIKD
ncbi:hypothetical protein [Poritiphilus flavus]|nr:hypothetical protein [Poritiphilus flavus]